MVEKSDEQIVALVQAGDAEAYGEIMTRYENKLKRYAWRFLNTREEIDDLVQDVFIKTYTNIKSFNTSLRFSPWIYRIAHNTFVNELKRKKHIFNFFDSDTILPLLASKETADADTMDNEINEELEIFVEKLPPKYREVIVLHYFESLSYQEISEVLHIPVTTVGVRMTRGRNKLKGYYQLSEQNHE